MSELDTTITFRELESQELKWISEIDRSEEINEQYVLKNGKLTLWSRHISSSGFDPTELTELIARQDKILKTNGCVFGVLSGEKLVGVASLENRKRGSQHNYMKMDILYVSKGHRTKGIGTQLLKMCKEKALQLDAKKLYVSATPTRATVDFYLTHGATLALEMDAELYELEPEDIHMEIDL